MGFGKNCICQFKWLEHVWVYAHLHRISLCDLTISNLRHLELNNYSDLLFDKYKRKLICVDCVQKNTISSWDLMIRIFFKSIHLGAIFCIIAWLKIVPNKGRFMFVTPVCRPQIFEQKNASNRAKFDGWTRSSHWNTARTFQLHMILPLIRSIVHHTWLDNKVWRPQSNWIGSMGFRVQ